MVESFDNKWNYPTEIHFGCGSIKKLPALCDQCSIKKPLLVTDPNLAEFSMVKDVLADCSNHGLDIGIFSSIAGNPTGEHIESGVEVYNTGGYDGIIAMGGGSAMDVGKTIALVAGQKRPWVDFEDKGDNYLRADVTAIAPIIAVPTTAGTGSEVGRAALIVDLATHAKKIIFHPQLLPAVVIGDPELTIDVPPFLTAATGMDAFAHNLEAYCVDSFHPMADGIALEGMRLIKEWLPIAYRDGGNLEARAYLMAAATMGATAFQKGLGAIHSLSHPVGALFGAHHGLLNAIFMPYVLEYNCDYLGDKMQRLARHLQLDDVSFAGVTKFVHDFNIQLGIPQTLSQIKITDEHVDEVVKQALADGSTPTNPRPMDTVSVERLYRQALGG